MDKLLSDDGCPWDRVQTHESLRQYLLEESYEAVDAIDNNDMAALCEELGDVLLEVVFHSKIAEKLNQFTLNDVIEGISKKMINRHRHIFGDVKADTPEAVLKSWEQIKDEEKGYNSKTDKMRTVAKALPALIRAEKIQKYSELEPITDKDIDYFYTLLDTLLKSTLASTKKSKEIDLSTQKTCEKQGLALVEEQIGNLLFFVVRICGFYKINPEFALTNALETYITKFENGENPVVSGFAAIN